MYISPEARKCILALSYFAKIGPTSIKLLESRFTNFFKIFEAGESALVESGLKTKIAEQFIVWRKNWDERPVLKELRENNINYATWHDPDYPAWLKEIPSPPPILYYIGSINQSVSKNLAIVGSRLPSPYAHNLIDLLVPEIVEKGIIVISGLAYGVDTLAHNSVLENKGITWAVLGSGLLKIYPAKNLPLAKKIVSTGGAIISEFAPHHPPLRLNFPQRNRIISGLSRATLIIEATESSGALITAKFALEQGRDVLAVPGNIFSQTSKGTNKLISAGAEVITSGQDILNIFGLSSQDLKQKTTNPSRNKPIFFDKIEEIVYLCLEAATNRCEKLTIDEIAEKTKINSSVICSKLSMLEIRGIAQSHGFRYDLS